MIKRVLAATALLLCANAFAAVSNYSQVYLRGTFNNWGTTTKMNLVADNTWEAPVTLPANAEFKFDINGDWTVSYGDDNKDGIADRSGVNIKTVQAGYYYIRFNDQTNKYDLLVESYNYFATAGRFYDRNIAGLPITVYKGSQVYQTGVIGYGKYGPWYNTRLPVGQQFKIVLDAATSDNRYQGELTFTTVPNPPTNNIDTYPCGRPSLGLVRAPRGNSSEQPVAMTCNKGVWKGTTDLSAAGSTFAFASGMPGQFIWGDDNLDGIAALNEAAIPASQQAVHDISIDLNTGAYTATPRSSGVTVNFTCNNGTTVSGQNVYAVGSISQLGNWAPAQGFKLGATSYPSWKGSITLPANTAVQWKCVKFNGTTAVWQGGSNNSFTTPASGSINATASF